MNGKLYNLRVSVYKGVPLPWMKWNPSFNDDWWPNIRGWKVSLSEKWMLNYTTLGFPFIRGFPSHERNETLLSTMTASQVYPCEKWHPSLMMTASQVYTCAKDSLSEKFVLKNATLGSPFIRGFPSHDVRMCRSFTFGKMSIKLCDFRVPVYKGVPFTWEKWNPSFNDDC